MMKKLIVSLKTKVCRFALSTLLFTIPIHSTYAAEWHENYFPNTILTNHNNEKVKFYDDLIKDKVVLINFIFTRCQNACPLETARLIALQNMLGNRVGKDIFFYSISIDPEYDTPERLNAYAKQYNITSGWQFLTGSEEDIIELRKKLGLYIDEIQIQGAEEPDHNLSLIIGNESTGRWMKRSPFEDTAILSAMVGDWLHNWKNTDLEQLVSYEQAPILEEESKGQYLFRTRCVTCHTYENKPSLGPSLIGVTQRRDDAWLKRWLKEPDKMFAEKDTTAIALLNTYNGIRMPNLQLTEQDISDIMAFLKEQDQLNLILTKSIIEGKKN
ncbi:SCO family protein [Photobacterium minamisatsumaniensis]|uniref:SCO family protein n=1 Tax=Photobacterium minamisatsumaniensis TaxID=2910233 RepID=UPI003D0B587C